MTNKIYKAREKYCRLMIIFYVSVLMTVFVLPELFAQEGLANAKKSAAAVIEQAMNDTGAEGARAKYFLLKTQKDKYAFVEAEFTALGNKLLQADQPHAAASVLEIATDIFPDSANMYMLLAVAHYAAGDSELSLEFIAKMRSIQNEASLTAFLKENEGKLASTAEEVIARHIKATGGREAWEQVKTMVVVFSVRSIRG